MTWKKIRCRGFVNPQLSRIHNPTTFPHHLRRQVEVVRPENLLDLHQRRLDGIPLRGCFMGVQCGDDAVFATAAPGLDGSALSFEGFHHILHVLRLVVRHHDHGG